MSLQKSLSAGSLSPGDGNSKQLTKSPSIVSLSKLWMVHVELLSGHNLAIRDRSGMHYVHAVDMSSKDVVNRAACMCAIHQLIIVTR